MLKMDQKLNYLIRVLIRSVHGAILEITGHTEFIVYILFLLFLSVSGLLLVLQNKAELFLWSFSPYRRLVLWKDLVLFGSCRLWIRWPSLS